MIRTATRTVAGAAQHISYTDDPMHRLLIPLFVAAAPQANDSGAATGKAMILFLMVGGLLVLLLLVVLLLSMSLKRRIAGRPEMEKTQHSDAWQEAGQRVRPLDGPRKPDHGTDSSE